MEYQGQKFVLMLKSDVNSESSHFRNDKGLVYNGSVEYSLRLLCGDNNTNYSKADYKICFGQCCAQRTVSTQLIDLNLTLETHSAAIETHQTQKHPP